MSPRRPLPGLELSNGEYSEKQERRRTRALCSECPGGHLAQGPPTCSLEPSSKAHGLSDGLAWFGSVWFSSVRFVPRLEKKPKVSQELDPTFDLHPKPYLPFTLVLFCLVGFSYHWLGSQCAAPPGLETPRHPPASASCLLGLQAQATTPSCLVFDTVPPHSCPPRHMPTIYYVGQAGV